MIQITLDTNCIINLLDLSAKNPTSVSELKGIINYALGGNVAVAVTTRVEYDLSKDKDKERLEQMIYWLNNFPVIGTIARFNYTKLDSGDILGGDSTSELWNSLKDVIFPSLDLHKKTGKKENKVSDLDHLLGHIINKRDLFVTDDKTILKKSEQLKKEFNLLVLSPSECLEYLEEKANPLLIAHEFLKKFEEYRDFLTNLDSFSDRESKIKYKSYRDWFTLKFPKIKNGLSNHRLKMISQPVGSEFAFNQIDLLNLQQNQNPFRFYYSELNPDLQRDKIISKKKSAIYRRRGEAVEENDIIEEAFDSPIELLLAYCGDLEE